MFYYLVLASLPNLSQLLGALVAGYTSNKIGRRKSMIFFCFPLLCGWLTIIFASGNSSIIMIGRLLKVCTTLNCVIMKLVENSCWLLDKCEGKIISIVFCRGLE